jgi:hypothetical protein
MLSFNKEKLFKQLKLENERQICEASINHQITNESNPITEHQHLRREPKTKCLCAVRPLPMQLFSDAFVAHRP